MLRNRRKREAAAQRLNDTGLFDEVTFQAYGPVLTYTLKPGSS